MKEFLKVIFIAKVIIAEVFKAKLKNIKSSKSFLAKIYLYGLQSGARIPTVNLNHPEEFSLVVSNTIVEDILLPMTERSLLLTEREIFVLLKIVKSIKPKIIFEFGLFKGGTLKHFILNTDESVSIYPLDQTSIHLEPSFRKFISAQKNVELIVHDSVSYNFSNFHEKVDFIFIDGGHDYEIVKSDTMNALKMLSENGVIVWDDFNENYPGVIKAVEELKDLAIYHLQATSFAIYVKNPALLKFSPSL